jgi:hypothetical protein
MAINKTMLIGNGICRGPQVSEYYPSWEKILKILSKEFAVPLKTLKSKPLPLVYERIRLEMLRENQDPYLLLKRVSGLMRDVGISSVLTSIYPSLTKNILTTNYNYALNLPPVFDTANQRKIYKNISENFYSLFRGYKDDMRQIWNIHGEVKNPKSILLGHAQYSKYMGQVKDYLYKGIKFTRVSESLRSPLSGKIPNFNFEDNVEIYSWVDLFLRDEIHVVGLGLDFSEIILWWLISEKMALQAKFNKKVGDLIYYNIQSEESTDTAQKKCTRSMLEDLGAKIISIEANSYEDGYKKIANIIRPGVVEAWHEDTGDGWDFLRLLP